MKTMGFVSRGANEQMFERVVEYFHERFQENISLDSLNLKDIKFDPQKGLESVADLRNMDISIREQADPVDLIPRLPDLIAALKANQTKKPRFAPDRFLESLFRAYRLIVGAP